MNKITLLVGSAVVLLLAGCYFGDRLPSSRTVALGFPAREGQSKVTLSVNDAEVQEAMRIVDSVMLSNGFVRNPDEPGTLASYSKYNGTGPRPIGGPRVLLNGDRLDVTVVEGGNLNSHLSKDTKHLCDLLKKEMSNRFGAQRVHIEN